MRNRLAVGVLVVLVASLSATTGSVVFSWAGGWGIGAGALLAAVPSVIWVWNRRNLIGDHPVQGQSDEAVGVSVDELLEDVDLARRIDQVLPHHRKDAVD